MILISPGVGDSLVLYDYNKNYDAVLVAPSSADLYFSYVDEDASASRFLATVPLDVEVVIPLATEIDRDITIRAITRSVYSPATSGQPDFSQSEQVTAESDRLAKAVLGLAVKAGKRFARVSVDNWNRFSRVRKVDVTTDVTFAAYTTHYFDLDRRKASGGPGDTEAEFNELPDYIDIERLAPNYPTGIAWTTDTYYVRVSHSVQSSGRAVGATYEAKVAGLRYSEVSNVLTFTFEGVGAGSAGAGVVGLPDPFPYPAGGGSGLVDSIRVSGDEYHLATPYRHGLMAADLPYGQYLGGRKVWTDQQIFADGAIDDWTRDGGNLGPIKTTGLRTAPTLPAVASLDYHADTSGDHVQIAAHGVWRHDTNPDPARLQFYRSTHLAGVTDDPPFYDTALALGRVAPAVWTNAAWRYSGRIDFALEAAIAGASNVVPVSVDIYGGSASSDTTDATGTRGLRIDSRGNAVMGVGALAVDSVGGYAYLPQFVGTPTTSAPAATHTGYVPVAMVGTALNVWNGSAWVGISGGGGSPGGSATELQYRAGPTTFGAVTGSSVSGAAVTLGGDFTLLSDASLIAYHRIYGSQSPLLWMHRGKGTAASPTAVLSGEQLGRIYFGGQADTSTAIGFTNVGASITVEAQANWDTGNTPADFVFRTKSGISAGVGTVVARFTHNQRVGIGSGITNADIDATLHVLGTLAVGGQALVNSLGTENETSSLSVWHATNDSSIAAAAHTPSWNVQTHSRPNGTGTGINYLFTGFRHGAAGAGNGDLAALYNLVGVGESDATGAGHDVVGAAGIGISRVGSTARVWGLFGDARVESTTGVATGAEFTARNHLNQVAPVLTNSAVPNGAVIGSIFAAHKSFNAAHTLSNYGSAAIWIARGEPFSSGAGGGANTGTSWIHGINFTQNSYVAYGIDFYFMGAGAPPAIRLSNATPIVARNAADSADVVILSLSPADLIAFAGGAFTISLAGSLGFADNIRQTFNPGAANAGLNVGAVATTDPGTVVNGDIWYNTADNALRAGINGAVVTLGSGTPKWNAITAPDGPQTLAMANHASEWTWGTAFAGNGLLLQANTTGDSGALLYVRTTHASAGKVPFRVDAQNALSFYVDATGRVGIKTTPNVLYEFTVAGKSYLGGDTDVAGRITATYSTAVVGNRTLFSSSTLTGANTQGSLQYSNLLLLADESTANSTLPFRSGTLFRYIRASAGADYLAYGVVSDMQFNHSSATLDSELWSFKAQGNCGSSTSTLKTYGGFYAEYPSGFGFLTNTYGFIAEGGLLNGFGTTLPTATLHVLGSTKLAGSTAATTGIQTLATFEHLSTGTPADGYGLGTLYNLSSTVQSRLAAQVDVRWQESTDADRSAVMSLRTIHKGQTVARERLLLGGYKALVDNTRTDIFSVVFDVADQKAVCGTVHLTVVAKQTVGSNQIQVYRKSIAFLALHNAATNTGTGRWGAETSGDAVTTTGGITFVFECNTVAYPTYAGTTNTLTYQLTADTDLTTVSEFFVQYNIEMNGEIDVAIAA